jgi:NADPH-dependent 2,4-dienoyl-CoA reductase/sulfur reductase-like enzyme/rhodanese-related sulfurtransferase
MARKIVIVGASAAGLRCAARLSRLDPSIEVTVIEQSDVFSYAACGLPYVLSGDIEDPMALRKTGDGALRDAEFFKKVKGFEVMQGFRALDFDVAKKTLRVASVQGEQELEWDDLVLAVGAKAKQLPNQPEHPRVQAFHTWKDLAPLQSGLEQGKIRSVAIVGAGLVGCELAEAFTAMWGAEVTLIEAAPYVLPNIIDSEVAAIVKKVLEENEVVVKTAMPVEGIKADDNGVEVDARGETITSDVAVVALGVGPAVDFAVECGVELGASGGIAVNDKLATNLDNVWAAGDCIQVRHKCLEQDMCIPLGSLANRQGRTLANILVGKPDKFESVVGATAVKIFDTNLAVSGATRFALEKSGRKVRCVWTSAHDTADYWPGSKNVAFQLCYEVGSYKVLGVQAIGQGEVAKRADLATQLIASDATLADFSQLEHAYAPPYSPALDPLAVIAFVALNQEDGVEAVGPEELLDDYCILDIRHAYEAEQVTLANKDQTLLPLAELRSRLDELKGKDWLVVCARGTRSAEAARYLINNKISAKYLAGGVHWKILNGTLEVE